MFAMIGKFGVSAGFGEIYLYTGELFPTVVRSLIMGLSGAGSRIGAILSPYMFYLVNELFSVCNLTLLMSFDFIFSLRLKIYIHMSMDVMILAYCQVFLRRCWDTINPSGGSRRGGILGVEHPIYFRQKSIFFKRVKIMHFECENPLKKPKINGRPPFCFKNTWIRPWIRSCHHIFSA